MIPADPEAGTTSGNASSDAAQVGSATHLFTRTTADGITIRAYRTADMSPCPVSPCVVGGAPVTVELSNASAVGQGSLFDGSTATTGSSGTSAADRASGASGTSGDLLSSSSGAFGVVEGTPVWWVAVSVGAEVATVQMTFADGSSDAMTPVNGVAVVAHGIDASAATSGNGPYDVSGTLRLLDSSGAVVDTVTFPEVVPTPTPLPVPDPGPGPITSPILTPASPAPTSPPATIVGGNAGANTTAITATTAATNAATTAATNSSTNAATNAATVACENETSPPALPLPAAS